MTITITKSGPFYVTAGTPISFSSLRTNFRATDIDGTVSADTSPISASQLRRIDSQSNSDPTVPDATENTQISTANNLNISQFRNSLKYYKVSQTDTDTNVNISTQAWNSNLSKNIKKKVSISGTIGYSDITIAALSTTSGQHCNLEIVVTGTGKVIGAGGAGGIVPPTTDLSGFERFNSPSLGLHFYTTNLSVELIDSNGYQLEHRNYFYVSTSSNIIIGTVPLYRFVNLVSGDHLFTLNAGEVTNDDNPWRYEAVVGYVWPPNAPGPNTAPIYRKFNGVDHLLTTDRNEGSGSYALDVDPLFYAVTNSAYVNYPTGANPATPSNGGNGGTAMNLLNTLAASVIKVTVASGANIYGGGGGGGGGTKGGTGGNGGSGTFTGTTYFECTWGGRSAVNGPPTFPFSFCLSDGGAYSCEGNKPANIFSISGCRGNYTLGNGCACDDCLGTCFSTKPVATTGGDGGPGGNGANGGVGAGYEQALGAAGSGVLAVTDWTGRIGGTNAGTGGKGGKGGDSGAGGTFGANGSPGTQGDPGVIGGDGSLVDGTVTTGSSGTAGGLPVGTGGAAGRAITGTNYSVTGTINSSTIKGLYNP